MNSVTLKNILLCAILLSIGIVVLKVVNNDVYRAKTNSEPSRNTLHTLPVDVEKVQEGFRYSEVNGGIQVEVSGKRIVRRGRKVLGLRSTLIKTNFYHDITGSLRTQKNNLIFSASKAEWDALATSPFILRKDIVVSLNGKVIPHVKRAKVNFQNGVLEIGTGRNKLYYLE